MSNASDAPPVGLVTRELVSAPRTTHAAGIVTRDLVVTSHGGAAPRPPRSPHEIRLVAVASHRDPRTVQAAYAGANVADLSLDSIADAAVRIGFAPPPRGAR